MENSTDSQLDQLFREHFRRELPEPWPPMQLPADESTGSLDSRGSIRSSRMALAASLGILVVSIGLAAALTGDAARPVGTLPRDGSARKSGTPSLKSPATETQPDLPKKETRQP